MGLLFLLDILISLVSSSPQDILAVNPSVGDYVVLPTGAGLLKFSVFTISLMVAVAILLASLGWPPKRSSIRLKPSVVMGILAAASLVAVGAYVSFAGIVDGQVSYDEHLVDVNLLESGALVVLACIFFSIALAAVVGRKMLLTTLVVWIAAGLAFGFLDTKPLDGLYLFERTIRIEEPAEFTAIVGTYRHTEDPAEEVTAPGETIRIVAREEVQPRIVVIKADPIIDAKTPITGDLVEDAEVDEDAPPAGPIFRVGGATHITYLRSAVGDVYDDGEWKQLDTQPVPIAAEVAVKEAVAPFIPPLRSENQGEDQPEATDFWLVAYPSVSGSNDTIDLVQVFPPDEGGTLQAGPAPVSQYPTRFQDPVTYDPFSNTLSLPSPTSQYGWWASVPSFSLSELVEAEAIVDDTYLQLPDDLPERIHQIAEEFKTSLSPFLNANQIMVYLADETFRLTDGTDAKVADPPAGTDPVDWFLFESREGTGGSFSSAFVVLARATGIPARVVTGWTIGESAGVQDVYDSQSHHWAEIALEGVGWFTFDHAVTAGLAKEVEALDLENNLATLSALLEGMERDMDIDVQLASLTALQHLSFEELVHILLNHEDPEMRRAAAIALTALKDLRAVEPFLQVLFDDEEAKVRVEVVRGLSYIGKGQAEEQLLQVATSDEDPSVREAAVRALGTLKTEWTARGLVPILGSDPTWQVREAAAWALGEIKEAVALRPLLLARSEDLEESVRQAAELALDKWTNEELVAILQQSEEAPERASAAELLGEREYIEAIPALSSALYDPSEEVRDAALTALERIGEVRWLENGLGLLTRGPGHIALIPGATSERVSESTRIPVFSLSGGTYGNLLRVAVGENYIGGTWSPREPQEPSIDTEYGDTPEDESGQSVSGLRIERARISISNAEPSFGILPGSIPISGPLDHISAPGIYRPESETYVLTAPRASYTWESDVIDYDFIDLTALSQLPPDSVDGYTELPDLPWVDLVRELAVRVTEGQSTTYGKSEAIEEFLRSEYTYGFADPMEVPSPTDRDPIDWFLFESREGTSGSFSSAFVIMARTIGIPARVVSGWAVDAVCGRQTIYSDQAHQWAEVALEGPGWIPFDATPGGAPSRASPWDALYNDDPAKRAEALRTLELCFDVIWLENGTALVSLGGGSGGQDGGSGGQGGYSLWVGGTTTRQAEELPHIPVFSVTGAANTRYLRTKVGDVYQGNYWRQLDPVSIPYSAGDGVTNLVSGSYNGRLDGFGSLPNHRIETESLFGLLESADSSSYDRISIDPAGTFTDLPAGLAPTSLHLQSVGHDGELYPFSATFSVNELVQSHSWTSEVPHYTSAQYVEATAASDPTYTELPAGLPERIRDLALAVTSGHSTAYAKARALEEHLATNYTYRLADASRSGDPPPGRDPVDWFLFDHREGTCGVFSTAFVVMARSIGIPARVVSGWAISATEDTQIVYADQAHQWAEVPFEGLGWVTFEPTAPGGATTRAAVSSVEDALASGDSGSRDEILERLEEQGFEVIRLENGSVLIGQGGIGSGGQVEYFNWFAGTTTSQLREAPNAVVIPLFSVSGAANTEYLRTSVGDFYRGGSWSQIDTVSIPYEAGHIVEGTVADSHTSRSDGFGDLPNHRVETESLFGLLEHSGDSHHDHIHIRPVRESTDIPAGPVPTSLQLRSVDRDGEFFPFSSTFISNESGETFSWTSEIPIYSASQYHNAVAASDPTYTQLPDGLPERIRDLALRVTSGHSSTYAKAKALEQFLSTNYAYAFADGSGDDAPPPGQDPVDWFLFDLKEGTCGQFSSAFVVMARSIGIPARVVSGWGILPIEDTQTVYGGQAHQWAEVPFEGLGWVTFEPTAPAALSWRLITEGMAPILQEAERPPQDTLTTITQWPVEVRRRTAFVVGGEVTTLDGLNVSGMEVEIYVNETKEHGGIKVGEAITNSDGYVASVELPEEVELGPYQLLARAVSNDEYNESWSDPDITVFSGSGLELTGPAEVTIDVEATFEGILTDDVGEGVADSVIAVTIDGEAAPSVTTDSSGEFSFSSTFDSAGGHWVEVEVEGQEFLLDNRARLNFQVTMPTETVLHAPAIVEVGQEFLITGELRDIRGSSLPGESVHVQVGEAAEQTLTTDSSGNFEFRESVSESGEYTVSAEFRRNGPLLASNGSSLLSSQHLVVMSIDGPGRIEKGQGTTFEGRLESATFAPTGDLELTLEDSSGRETTSISTDENGRFAHTQSAFSNTGLHFLTGHYPGEQYVGSSTAGISFYVYAPTMLTLEAPKVVREGVAFMLSGALVQEAGQPVPEAEIQVTGAESRTLVTDADGRFSWEATAVLDRSQADDVIESALFFEVAFTGTDHLGPSTTNSSTLVGLPRIVVEAMEPIARGETATLRGTVLLGNSPTPGVLVGIGQEVSQESDEAGAFILDYPVPSNTPVGTWEVVVSAPDIEASFTVGIEVRSAPRMRFDPSDLPAPENTKLLTATILDDTGTGIAGATLRSDQGVEAITDDFGMAVIEVMTPETKEAVIVPVVVSFDGDARNLPLAESLALAIPAVSGFNWLLWVGLPGMVALIAASVLAGRRLRTVNVPVLIRRRGAAAVPGPGLPVGVPDLDNEEGEDVEESQATVLEVAFNKADPGLDDVWGLGEDVSATITLTDEDGEPISAASVNVSVAGWGAFSRLVTDASGECSDSWTGGQLGDYRVVVVYEGDEGYLPTSTSAVFRVVDFREEIVRLYNLFIGWVTERTASVTEQSTPREIEVILVSEGVRLDQKSLDELISRFEEADYSEHPIARRHYDAMYRAWREIVRG